MESDNPTCSKNEQQDVDSHTQLGVTDEASEDKLNNND